MVAQDGHIDRLPRRAAEYDRIGCKPAGKAAVTHTNPGFDRRAEVERLLAADNTVLGRLWKYDQEDLSPQQMTDIEEGVSRPVGRVLCARLRGPAVIHLGLPLPAASCGLPASIGRAALNRSRRPAPLTAGMGPLDLAPGGVYRAAAVTCGAGGLLHHRFTLTVTARKRAATAV